jgi:hypothetical protein
LQDDFAAAFFGRGCQDALGNLEMKDVQRPLASTRPTYGTENHLLSTGT